MALPAVRAGREWDTCNNLLKEGVLGSPMYYFDRDAFYDRRNIFPPNCVLDDGGTLRPKIVGMPVLFQKTKFLYTLAMAVIIGMRITLMLKTVFG